jgi:hypothetical protein
LIQRDAAPRPLARLWHCTARGALLAVCLWQAGAAAAQIAEARYADPTTRYNHGVLGDAVEWGALELMLADGSTLRAVLPERLVFEDTAPRLADLDGDGEPEVITVESDAGAGARLAIWGETGRIAATPHIGTRNRWLAPIGAADLDGDGAVEIAYVDRPHLAKTLRVWRFVDGGLTEVASAPGLSNHRIGWDYIVGGIRQCGSAPEMIVASGDWAHVVAVTFGGDLSVRRIARYSPDRIAKAMTCK